MRLSRWRWRSQRGGVLPHHEASWIPMISVLTDKLPICSVIKRGVAGQELPLLSLLHTLLDLVLVVALKLVLEFFFLQRVPHREAVVLESVLRLNLPFVGLVFSLVLLCFRHHAVNL